MSAWYDVVMRNFLTFLLIVGLMAVAVLGYLVWRSFSGIAAAETILDERLNTLITFYADMDTQYVTPLKTLPELPQEWVSGLDAIHGALTPLASPPESHDARLGILMDALKHIRTFLSSGEFPSDLTASPFFQSFSKEASHLGKASLLLKEYNDAVGAYNGQLLSRTGQFVGQWSSRTSKQFLNIDGTLSSDTVILFN